jgi:hypothetical protein
MGLVILLAASLLAQDDPCESIYKFKPGTTWSFIGVRTGKGPNFSKMELKVLSGTPGRTELEAKRYRGGDEPEVVTVRWSVDQGILSWAEIRDGKERDQMQLHKAGAKKGDTWEWTRDDDQKAQGKSLGVEEVKVPAGTYKDAIHTRVEPQGGPEKFGIDFYFAPGVGPVKMVAGDERGSLTLELKEFKSAK